MIINFIVLAGLVKLVLTTEKPILCAGIYTVIFAITASLLDIPRLYFIISIFVAFGLSLLYFWLLDRYRDSWIFWLVLILGLGLGVV